MTLTERIKVEAQRLSTYTTARQQIAAKGAMSRVRKAALAAGFNAAEANAAVEVTCRYGQHLERRRCAALLAGGDDEMSVAGRWVQDHLH